MRKEEVVRQVLLRWPLDLTNRMCVCYQIIAEETTPKSICQNMQRHMHVLQKEYVRLVEEYRSQYPAAHWCLIDNCLEDAVFSDGKVWYCEFHKSINPNQQLYMVSPR